MTGNHDGRYVSIPVVELEALSRRVDAAADDIDRSQRRLEADTTEAVLNGEDPGLSPTGLRSRLLSTVADLRRVTAQMRATAGLMADTTALATAGDDPASGPSLVDTPIAPVGDVVDQLSGYADPGAGTTRTADPGWQRAWEAASGEE